VSDLIDGIIRLLMSDEHLPVNIGNPIEISILEFAKKINEIIGNHAGLEFKPDDRIGCDPQRRRPDITRANNLLGWEPQVCLEEGIQKTIPYFQSKLGSL
jgi:dTDP-glucose 4,6-dehydratase